MKHVLKIVTIITVGLLAINMATVKLGEKMVTTDVYDDVFTSPCINELFDCSFDEAYYLIEKNGGKLIKVSKENEHIYEITCRNEYQHASYYSRFLYFLAPLTNSLPRKIIVKTFT